MKHIWVKYRKGTEDIVHHKILDDLLVQDAIECFYRPSEARWINPGIDKIRKMESTGLLREEFCERRD